MLERLTRTARGRLHAASSIGCYLGSYDPPHHGHVGVARALLREVDAVLMLIPTQHFHKAPAFPANATFAQRLAMLGRIFCADVPVCSALTDVVLFLELDQQLRITFPAARLLFGMGDETYRRLLASPAYYSGVGKPWSDAQERALADLQRRCRIWNRSGSFPAGTAVRPAWGCSQVSSTRVRQTARVLWQTGEALVAWHRALDGWVPPSVVEDIYRFGIYRPLPGERLSDNGPPEENRPRRP